MFRRERRKGARIVQAGANADSMDGKLGVVSERLVKVEAKLEAGHAVLSRS
jgi:hypothetical protein